MIDNSIKILLIEDDPGDVCLLQETLSEVDEVRFEVNFVDRLSSGIEKLTIGGFDIVLLDLSLPDSQGLDTFVKLHKNFANVPVVILTGIDDEKLATRAVQKGAQDYLVKAQLNKYLLVRTIRYAIERHRLQMELEKVWQREQQKRESKEVVRNFQHYVAISQEKSATKLKDLPHLDDKALDALIPDYREIVLNYVRAIRIREDRPSGKVRKFAQQLALLNFRACDVVRLHLNVLNEFSQRAMPSEERAFSNDARLILVELMGNLMDIYLSQINIKDATANIVSTSKMETVSVNSNIKKKEV